jgi:chaperonin GroES
MTAVKATAVPEKKKTKKEPNFGLRAFSDRILLKKIDLEVKTSSGIILGEVEKDREIVYGRVLGVGPGFRLPNGDIAPVAVRVGEIVAFREQLPTRATYRGEYFWVLREQDLMFAVDDNDIIEKPYQLEGYEFDQQVRKM